ncbi:hypothetical protein RCO48_00555 [Peribacillus frigoritolerans]|nr:hypothetical protein [Peribacillus frigoritolerans]
MEQKGRDSCGKKRVYGRPRRCKPRRLTDRPRKSRAWSGNQRSTVKTIKILWKGGRNAF